MIKINRGKKELQKAIFRGYNIVYTIDNNRLYWKETSGIKSFESGVRVFKNVYSWSSLKETQEAIDYMIDVS